MAGTDGRVLALKPGGAFDERVECAVLAVRRAEIAHADVRFVLDPLLQGGDKTRNGVADADGRTF